MSYTQSNNILEQGESLTNRTKSNMIVRTGTAIAISTLISLSYNPDCIEDLIAINNTNTFQFIGNQEMEQKKSYEDRYSEISQADWYIKSYQDMSIGELINLD